MRDIRLEAIIIINLETNSKRKAYLDQDIPYTIEDALYTMFGLQPDHTFWWEHLENLGHVDFEDLDGDIWEVDWNGATYEVTIERKFKEW